jgi:hypothetical protein
MLQNFQKAIKELDSEKLYSLLKSKIQLQKSQEFCKINTPENLKKMINIIRDEFRARDIHIMRVENNQWKRVTDIPELTDRIIAVYSDDFKINGIGIY